MTSQHEPDAAPDEGAVAAFADRLDAYAQTLSPRERRTLETMILLAMDPIDRIRWRRDPAALLSPREEAFLQALAKEERSS